MVFYFFFSSRRRHTRCALVTGVQTCALPIYRRSGEYPKVLGQVGVVEDDGCWELRLRGGERERDAALVDRAEHLGHTAEDGAAVRAVLQVMPAVDGQEIGRASCRERVCQDV